MTELQSPRIAYGEALVELGASNENVMVLSADVSNSDHSYMFADAYPERFVNVGIAEQSLVDVAVGMAKCGKIPFANTFAFLFATRALEMIRSHLCYGRTNVKLMGAYAGLSDFFDGPTHHSISDIAIMRSLPGMTIVNPADATAIRKLLPKVAEWDGPVFMRLSRNPIPVVFQEDYAPEIGKAVSLRDGEDVTLIGTGLMVFRCLEAAAQLEMQNIHAGVLEIHTIKPLDEEAVQNAAEQSGCLVTVEEHSVIGGLGSAVAEVVTDMNHPAIVKRVGIHDRYTETGPNEELLDRYGMSINDIMNSAVAAVQAKSVNPSTPTVAT